MRFALDTGIGVETVTWREVANLLAVGTSDPNGARSPAPGNVRAEISNPLTFEFWGQAYPNARMAVVDAPAFAKWQIQGLIGWPAVRNNIWLFDLAHGDVHVLPQLPEVKDWLKYPVAKNVATLAIEVPRAERQPGFILFDTGSADGVVLSPPLWQSWRTAHPDVPVTYDKAEVLAHGYFASEIGVGAEWSVDRLVLKDVLVAPANPAEAASFGPNYLATFGLAALRKLTVVVDGKNGVAYIRSSDAQDGQPAYNRLGAIFVPREGAPTEFVALVRPGSPAANAGMQDGDELLALDGLSVGHLQQRPGAWPLHEQFVQPAGTRLDIDVKRRGKRVTLEPVLQDFLHSGPAAAALPRYPAVPEFHFLPPMSSLIRKADALKLPIRGFALSPERGTLRKDDKVTALVTVVDDDALRQWVVLVVGSELKPSERVPGKPTHIFTSSGRDLSFQRRPTGVAIRSVGPFTLTNDADAEDKWSGAILDEQLLAVGFDSVSVTMQKLAASRNGRLECRGQPFSGPDVANNRRSLEAAGIGPDDERAFVAGGAALAEFLRVAGQTPGVRDVLRQLLDLSWKDYLHFPNVNVALKPLFEHVSADWWGLPASLPCRTVAFQVNINGTPRLICRVAATPPTRPLQGVAGIVGLAVGRVDGTGPHVMVRVLGGSLGGGN